MYLFIHSFNIYSCYTPSLHFSSSDCLFTQGCCSIRSPLHLLNPLGLSCSYGCPLGPSSQGDLRGSSPQRRWRRKGRLQGKDLRKRPSTISVWGWGEGDKSLKIYKIEGPRGLKKSQMVENPNYGSEDFAHFQLPSIQYDSFLLLRIQKSE